MVLSSMPCIILKLLQGGRHSCSAKVSDLSNRWSKLNQNLVKMPICSPADIARRYEGQGSRHKQAVLSVLSLEFFGALFFSGCCQLAGQTPTSRLVMRSSSHSACVLLGISVPISSSASLIDKINFCIWLSMILSCDADQEELHKRVSSPQYLCVQGGLGFWTSIEHD